MDKIFKSIFQSNDKKKQTKSDGSSLSGDDKSDISPALDGRRKLSISRSGRMKQNKKRSSLSLDIFGNVQTQEIKPAERPKTMEYHVKTSKTKTENLMAETKPDKVKAATVKTPEEEIDSAFEIIDKSLELT